MKYKARKTGNSLSVTIPTFVTNQLSINNGDNVTIELKDKEIIIRKEKTEDEKD